MNVCMVLKYHIIIFVLDDHTILMLIYREGEYFKLKLDKFCVKTDSISCLSISLHVSHDLYLKVK